MDVIVTAAATKFLSVVYLVIWRSKRINTVVNRDNMLYPWLNEFKKLLNEQMTGWRQSINWLGIESSS